VPRNILNVFQCRVIGAFVILVGDMEAADEK
jgi:hypothetical protein